MMKGINSNMISGREQIAGLIDRRIVCEKNENDEVKQGDRFGI